MSNKSIRGEEVTLRFVIDGDHQAGSFLKVVNFKVTPKADLTESDFVGDKESENDFQHHGFDFSFELQDEDGKAWEVYDKLVLADRNGASIPKMDIVAVYKYRDLAKPSKTRVLERAVFKLDSHDVNGRKEYVKNSFSGKARRCSAG